MANQENWELLEELLLARGPGGQEDEVAAICRRELEPVCDEVWSDPAGNLIGRLDGRNPDAPAVRVMAHLDEIAMVIKRIDEDGGLRVFALGGAFPANFGMCPVDVMGNREIVPGVLSFGTMHGTSATPQSQHVLSGDVGWNDVHVITRRSKPELGELGIRAGTRVVLSQHWRKPFRVHDAVAAHFLDDRAPILAALCAARSLSSRREELEQDVYFVFTSSEEETNAGAQYAARTLPGEICIALEVGPVAQEYDTHLCNDPIVLTGDEKGYYSRLVSDALLLAAAECGYCPQPALMPGFASDASAVLVSGASAQAGCLAIPTENTHGYEMITDGAIEACAETLVEYLIKPTRSLSEVD